MATAYEILEHTADTGVRAHGDTCVIALENVAHGMMSLVASPDAVRDGVSETFTMEAVDGVGLLVAFLNEIIYRMETQCRVYGSVAIQDFAEWRLTAELRGEPFDVSRHGGGNEIKAATYHNARLERAGGGWVAEILLDL